MCFCHVSDPHTALSVDQWLHNCGFDLMQDLPGFHVISKFHCGHWINGDNNEKGIIIELVLSL